MNKKIISEQQEETITNKITEQYGDFGTKWTGAIFTINGDEKFYAVKKPTAAQWHEYQSNLILCKQRIDTLAASTKPVTHVSGPQNLMINLVADCLITDVPGVATSADFLVDVEESLEMYSDLSSMLVDLSKTNIRQLKKK